MLRRLVEAVLPVRLGTGFRWLVASWWTSNLGDGFALAAAPLLVASQTHNPTLVALSVLLQRLPWILFGNLAGALADRVNRVSMVVVADAIRGVVVALLGATVWLHHVDITVVLVGMSLAGLAEVFSNTAASTLLPSLVARDDLAIANARITGAYVIVNQLVGPPLGAALYVVNQGLPFLGQAVLVIGGVVLIARVRVAPLQPAARRRVREEVADGFRWVWTHAAVRTLTLTILVFNITFGAAWSILVLYATERLHMGSVGFGLLTAAGAVGGLLSTLLYGPLTRRVSLGNIMRVGLIIETLTHLSLALTTMPAVAVAVMVVFGGHAFVWGTTASAVRQRAVPAEFQGRVSGVYNFCLIGGLVIGAALTGPIADRFGITGPFWFAFAGSGLFVVLMWPKLSSIAHEPAVVATPMGGDASRTD